MSQKIDLTAVIEKEGDGYVAFCPELDIASQGESATDAKQNLIEALELFFECASDSEIHARLNNELEISKITVHI